jgi:hypothetical protein
MQIRISFELSIITAEAAFNGFLGSFAVTDYVGVDSSVTLK